VRSKFEWKGPDIICGSYRMHYNDYRYQSYFLPLIASLVSFSYRTTSLRYSFMSYSYQHTQFSDLTLNDCRVVLISEVRIFSSYMHFHFSFPKWTLPTVSPHQNSVSICHAHPVKCYSCVNSEKKSVIRK
jgi:hypothetical protein